MKLLLFAFNFLCFLVIAHCELNFFKEIERNSVRNEIDLLPTHVKNQGNFTLPEKANTDEKEQCGRTRRDIYHRQNIRRFRRLSLGRLCTEDSTVSFGMCSSIFLRCGHHGMYSLEKCAMGQVFLNGRCQEIHENCIHRSSVLDLTMEVEQLVQDTGFCVQGEGAYLAVDAPCSRQAVVCSNRYEGFVFSCLTGMVMSNSLECVKAPPNCEYLDSDLEHSLPFANALADRFCESTQHAVIPYPSFPAYSSISECRTWYVDCGESQKKIINCDIGQFYDSKLGKCTHEGHHSTCFSCRGREWQTVEVNKCSQSFIYCEGAIARKYVCSQGFVFSDGRCVEGSKCATCREGATQQLSFDRCNEFSECVAGSWVRKECPSGTAFSVHRRECVSQSTCATPKLACSMGSSLRLGCGEYMDCTWSGNYQRKWCPAFHTWDTQLRKCRYEAKCALHKGEICKSGEIIETLDCKYFLICIDGSWSIKECKDDSVGCTKCVEGIFEEQIGTLSECVDGDFMEDSSECSYFLSCQKGTWTRFKCPHEWNWDNFEKKCRKGAVCDHRYRPATCDHGQRLPYDNDGRCDGYFECINGWWTFFNCQQGYVFDFEYNVCVRSSGGCPHATAEYSLLHQRKWDNRQFQIRSYNLKGHALTADYCIDGEKLPHEFDCSSYFLCRGGRLHRERCHHGVFNPSIGLCTADYQCPHQYPRGCASGEIRTDPTDCAAYTVCVRGIFERRRCTNGFRFNIETKTCIPGSCHHSDNAILNEKCVESGGPVGYRADPFNCRKFYQCAHGRWVHKECPSNLAWNIKLVTCDWPKNVPGCHH